MAENDTSIVNLINDVSNGIIDELLKDEVVLSKAIALMDLSINELNDALADLSSNIEEIINNSSIADTLNDVSNGLFNMIMDTSDSLKEYVDMQDSSLLGLLNDVSNGIIDEILKNEKVTAKSIIALGEAAGTINDNVIQYEPATDATYISEAESLMEADEMLDAAIADVAENITANTSALEQTLNDVSEGLINMIMDSSEFLVEYIDTQDSSLLKLLNDVSDGIIDEVLKNERVTSESIIALGDAAGTINNDVIEYVPSENATYIANAESLMDADVLLDAAIANVAENVTANTSALEQTLNDVSDGLFNMIMDTSDVLKEYSDTQDSSLLQLLNDVSNGIIDEIIKDEKVTAKSIIAIGDAAGIIYDNIIQYIPATNANYISDAESLMNADVLLDAAITDIATDISTNNSSLKEYVDTQDSSLLALLNDVSEGIIREIIDDELVTAKSIIALGEAAGTIHDNIVQYIPDTTATYISEAASLTDADELLDAAIAGIATDISTNNSSLKEYVDEQDASLLGLLNDVSDGLYNIILDNEVVTANALIALGEAAGTIHDDVVEYVPNTDTSYIATAGSLTEADELLDAAIVNETASVRQEMEDLLGLLNDVSNGIIDELIKDEYVIAKSVAILDSSVNLMTNSIASLTSEIREVKNSLNEITELINSSIFTTLATINQRLDDIESQL